MHQFILQTNPQWHEILSEALLTLTPGYLEEILSDNTWLPGVHCLFAAFSHPLDHVRYVLLGESPYPRSESANGYAFWDNAVKDLWSAQGLSKPVNRATSLRNLMKMLLLARGDLSDDLTQEAIAALDKSAYCQTASQLFTNMTNKGILLLNASLVYRKNKVNYDARQWRPFILSVLSQLALKNADIQLILLGRIAGAMDNTGLVAGLIAEHPYNISFITNPNVLKFFKPLDLLRCYEN